MSVFDFNECCTQIEDCCYNYFDCCPIAPYTGYILLGLLTMFFFVMWSRASAKAKALKLLNDMMRPNTKG